MIWRYIAQLYDQRQNIEGLIQVYFRGMGDGEIWEGVDRWYQLANKFTSRTLSSLKITSSCFFLTIVSTQTNSDS